MITDNKYYLYRHIRLDKNEPFYIGIGGKPAYYDSFEMEYRRAFDIKRRSIFWKNIVKKTEYEVEILYESDNYEFIKEKEKEFIKLYGRKDIKTGCLVNMTNGGECGPSIPKKIIEYDINGNFVKVWESMQDAALFYNIDRVGIGYCCSGKIRYYKKRIWKLYTSQYNNKISSVAYYFLNQKYSLILSNNVKTGEVKEFPSLKICAAYYNQTPHYIRMVIRTGGLLLDRFKISGK